MKNEYVEKFRKFLCKVQNGVLPMERQTDAWGEYNKEFTITQIKSFKLATQVEFRNLKILDVGCGLCDALDIFVQEGAKAIGIALSQRDVAIGKEKGHDVYFMDQSFMDFEDDTFDIVWSKHCLEHSFMPAFTLSEYYRVMKPNAYLYVEVPAPQTVLNHQNNPEHFSVFTKACWASLFKRAGFELHSYTDIKFKIMTKEGGFDLYYAFILKRGNVV